VKWFARCSCPLRSAMPLRGRRLRSLSGRVGALALVAGAIAASPAVAADVGFDDLASLSDVAQAQLPGGIHVSTALVLSESDAALLTGFDTQGTWATSGANGLLNTLASTLRFTFDSPVSAFSIDVLALERDGVALPVVLRGFDGANFVSGTQSDIGQIGDSGLPEQRLSLTGLFTSVELSAGDPTSSDTSTFFADSASFTAVPEPGTLALVGSGIVLLAGAARARGLRV
jgi:hypothetical protein